LNHSCQQALQTRRLISSPIGPVYGGAIGDEIKRRVCNACWQEWFNGFGVKVINEMQLNMRNPEHTAMLMEQMRLFLNMPKEG